jgi:hypothetical protein
MSLVASTSSCTTVLPPASLEIKEEDISVENLEQLMKQLYEIIATTESRAMSNLSFAVHSERAYREALSHKIEEEQSRLSAALSANGLVAKVANIVTPLCLAAEGIVSIVTEGPGARNIAAIALGSVLALDATLDAVCDHSAKKFLASCLQRVSNEDEKTWLERITTTCAVASIALGVGLPGGEAAQLATAISNGVLSCTRAGVQWTSDKQEAVLLEIGYAWEQSGRNMHSLIGSIERQQESPHDQLKLLLQLQQSNNATIHDIFV